MMLELPSSPLPISGRDPDDTPVVSPSVKKLRYFIPVKNQMQS